MAARRTYGDRCGIARALDVVGERWALLVVRELLLGPKRFTDLRAGLPHVGPDVLSQRLRDLESAAILRRRTLPPPAPAQLYELTERGQELEPVVLALGRWGSAAPLPDGEASFAPDSAVLALKTRFDPAAADGVGGSYELRLNGQPFQLRVDEEGFHAARGTVENPDASIATDPDTLVEVLWHGRSRPEAERSGAFEVAGDRRAAARFLRLFPTPGA
jgi:DNA-binding HxlR family transcriptional regulator